MHWDHLPAALHFTSDVAMHRCERNWRWERPHFTDYDFWLVLDGRGTVVHNGERVEVSRGRLIVFQPGDSASGRHDPDHPLRVFACHFSLARGFRMPRTLWPLVIQAHDIAQMEANATDLLRAAEPGKAEGGALARLLLARLLLQAFMDSRSKPADSVDLRLREAARKIAADPAAPWTTSEMARTVGLSVSQFNRRFHRLMGTSPARYLIERKIDRAKRLLLESSLSLKEIGEALNYGDIYYFHRQFREETGTTPRRFRAINKEQLTGSKGERLEN